MTGSFRQDPVILLKLELVEWLERRIVARKPAAVVRFGDGEEDAIAATSERASIPSAARKMEGQSGLRLSDETVLEVGRAILRAFDEADVLGILFGSFDRQRLNPLTKLYLERVEVGRKPAILSGTLLQHTVLDKLPTLLAGRYVSVVSCRNVKPVLEEDWGLADVTVYQVPSSHRERDLDAAFETSMHDVAIWPDRHRSLQAELKVREQGEIFLVGAGMFGKAICIDIREKGGLAIDLGSGLDRIVGKITRGAMRRVRNLHNKGMQLDEIVHHMEDLYRVKLDPEKVKRLTGEESLNWTGNPHSMATIRYVEDA